MKIDFSQEIKTIEGDSLKRPKRDGDEIIQVTATLGWAGVEALLASNPKEDLSGEEKGRRYELALKVQAATGAIDLPVEDVALLKKLCDQQFAVLIAGQTRRMLDAKSD